MDGPALSISLTMKRSAHRETDGRPGCARRPRAEPAVAEASTALLAAAHRLLTEREGVQRQPPPAASRPGPEVAAAATGDAAAPPSERGSHHLGSRLLVALSLIAAADYASPISLLPSAEGGNLLLSLAAFL